MQRRPTGRNDNKVARLVVCQCSWAAPFEDTTAQEAALQADAGRSFLLVLLLLRLLLGLLASVLLLRLLLLLLASVLLVPLFLVPVLLLGLFPTELLPDVLLGSHALGADAHGDGTKCELNELADDDGGHQLVLLDLRHHTHGHEDS